MKKRFFITSIMCMLLMFFVSSCGSEKTNEDQALVKTAKAELTVEDMQRGVFAGAAQTDQMKKELQILQENELLVYDKSSKRFSVNATVEKCKELGVSEALYNDLTEQVNKMNEMYRQMEEEANEKGETFTVEDPVGVKIIGE